MRPLSPTSFPHLELSHPRIAVISYSHQNPKLRPERLRGDLTSAVFSALFTQFHSSRARYRPNLQAIWDHNLSLWFNLLSTFIPPSVPAVLTPDPAQTDKAPPYIADIVGPTFDPIHEH